MTLLYDQATDNSQTYSHTFNGDTSTHYDCLGFILTRKGKKILPNLGTIDDGTKLHYGDYKNPVTHNTLVVDQQNQSPVNPKVLGYEETDHYTVIDSVLDWSKSPANVENHPLMQSDDKVYRDVQFRRVMIWLGDAAIEIDQIENPHSQPLDLTYRVHGKRKFNHNWMNIENPLNGPLALLIDTTVAYSRSCEVIGYDIKGEADYHQHIWVNKPSSMLSGCAPHNPATSELDYLLVRNYATQFSTVVLHDLSDKQEYALIDVCWHETSVCFVLGIGNQRFNASYDFNTRKCELDSRFVSPSKKVDAERLYSVWGTDTIANIFF